MQLEDLITTYPSIRDEDIQTKISAKYEFAELASSPKDPPPKPNHFYKHQIFTQRYMKIWDRMMIISETGTGKSYLAGALGEIFRKMRNQDSRGINGVIILVKGKNQVADMRKTLLWNSTGGYYRTEGVMRATGAQSVKNNATRALGEWYEIMTYGIFNGKVANMSDAQIRAQYSGKLIIIDEIHNLRIAQIRKEQGYTLEARKTLEIYNNIWRLTHIPDLIKVVGLTASVVVNHPDEFIDTMNLILPSADKTREDEDHIPEGQIPIGTDIDNMTLDELEHYIRGHISFVRALNTGIQIIRHGDTIPGLLTVDTRSAVYKIPSKLVLKKLYMGHHQSLSYMAAGYIGSDTDNFQFLKKSAASWVYPDGSWGLGGADKNKRGQGTEVTGGFRKYYSETNENWYQAKEDLVDYLNEENIGELSIKDEFIYKTIEKSTGVVVIFDRDVHGGILDLAIFLSYMGYEPFNESESVFESGKKRKGNRVIKPSFAPKKRIGIFNEGADIQNLLEVAESYENRHGDYIKVFLITEASKEGITINNMKTYIQRAGVWRSSDEYQAQSRGIRSTSHVYLIEELILNIMNLEKISYKEAKAKAIFEIDGYFLMAVPTAPGPTDENEIFEDDIILQYNDEDSGTEEEDSGEEGEDSGTEEEDSGEEGVTLNYSYISRKINDRLESIHKFAPNNGFLSIDIERDINKLIDSVDLYLYRKAEGKNVSYKVLMRKLKQIAVDCQIHRKRNIRKEDQDYSPECDYMECDYKCFSPSPTEIDYSTYDIYYLGEAIERLSEDIQEYFSRNGYGTIDEITKVIRKKLKVEMQSKEDETKAIKEEIKNKAKHLVRKDYVSISLANMIMNKVPVRNRFGSVGFLQESSGVYGIRDFPTKESISDPSLSFYNQSIISRRQISLKDAFLYDLELRTKGLINQLEKVPVTDPEDYQLELSEILKTYRVENEIGVVEWAIMQYTSGNKTPLVKAIMIIYKNVWYKIKEPAAFLMRKAEILRSKTKKKVESEIRGGKSGGAGKISQIEGDLNGEIVYYHAMISHIPEKTSYRVITRILKAEAPIRLFKASEGKWREANPVEQIVYNELVRNNIQLLIDPYEKHPIYGMIMLNGMFSIRDKSEEDDDSGKSQKKRKRGRECKSFTPSDHRDYMWSLGIRDMPEKWDLEKDTKEYTKKNQKLELIRSETRIEFNTDGWDDDQILFYFAWTFYKSERDEICDLIMDKMENDGILLRWRKF